MRTQFASTQNRQDNISRRSSSGQKRSSTSAMSGTQGSGSDRKSKSSYDPNFRQNLIDCGIYPAGYEPHDNDLPDKPGNFNAIRQALPVSRASLSPSRFTESSFEEFVGANDRALGETSVMANVFTIIEGEGRREYFSDGPDHPFNHLEPFGKYLPAPKPDIYDGVRPEVIDLRVRQDLGQRILPCNDSSRPAAPNFFVEGKSQSGRADVAKLQATHDGAVGSRVIDRLENYGQPQTEHDGNMKSFSCIYHPATTNLKLFGHHTTAPQAPGLPPQYHMTQIKGYDMSDSAETFRLGATAFRNLRDLAASTRNSAVQKANRAARHAPTPSPSTTFTETRDSRSMIYEHESDTSTDELAAQATTMKRQKTQC